MLLVYTNDFEGRFSVFETPYATRMWSPMGGTPTNNHCTFLVPGTFDEDGKDTLDTERRRRTLMRPRPKA